MSDSVSKNVLESSAQKPSVSKGILWGMFSATATLSVFLLPIHIFALSGVGLNIKSGLAFQTYLFVVLFCALYHGLYRTKTIVHDLGFGRYERLISWCFYILALAGTAVTAYLSFS